MELLEQKTIANSYIFLLFLLGIIISNPAHAIDPRFRSSFVQLEDLQQSSLEFFISKESLNHDISHGDTKLRVIFDGTSLLKEITYPQNIKLEVSIMVEDKKELISLINKTVKNKKAAENIFFPITLPRIEETSELILEVYDSQNILSASFIQEINVIASGTTSESSIESVPSLDCTDSDGECLIEFLLRNVTFSANYDVSLKTEIYKNDKGRYFVNIPIKQGRKLGKKVRETSITGSGKKTKNGTDIANFNGVYPYLENGENTASSLWNDIRDAIEFKIEGSDKGFYFKKDGSLQLSTLTDDGFINIAAGTNSKAPIVLSQGDLLDTPVEGAIEFDGSDLYFTKGGIRSVIGAGSGLQGPPGLSGATGAVGPAGTNGIGVDLSNGGYAQDTIYFVQNGKLQDVVFNGTISIPNGASAGFVLTSDTNGFASWQAASGGTGDITSVGDCLTGTCDDFTLTAATVGTRPLAIRAAAGQTANLQEWQTSTPLVRAHITENAEFSNTMGQTNSEAFGASALVSAASASAFGNNARASGSSSTAVGYNSKTNSSNSVAIGANSNGRSTGTVAIGVNSQATDQYNVAVGYNARALEGYASADGATAIGYNALAYRYSVAVGKNARILGTRGAAVAVGEGAQADVGSIALGYNAIAARHEFIVGSNANPGNITYGTYVDNVYIGGGKTSTNPSDITYHGTSGSGTDIHGSSMIFAAGQSTGTGAGGDIIFSTAAPSVSSATLNSLTERVRIYDNGLTRFNGPVRINDGTQATGFILTSDANGLASWQAIASGAEWIYNGNVTYVGESTDDIAIGGINEATASIYIDTSDSEINAAKFRGTISPTNYGGYSWSWAHHPGGAAIYGGAYNSGNDNVIHVRGSANRNLLFKNQANNTVVTIEMDNGDFTTVGQIHAESAWINGSLQITDGTQATGFVLTSDTNGLASWQAASGGGGNGDITSVGDCLTGACSDFSLTATTIGTIPLSIRATAGQTSNITEWQNGGGQTFAHITNNSEFSNNKARLNSEYFGKGATGGGDNQTVIGAGASIGSTTSGANSTVIGAGAYASSQSSVAIGHNASTIQYGVAIGRNATTSGSSSVVIGYGANASNQTSTVIGAGASSGAFSDTVVLGTGATATAQGQFVVGSSTYPINNIYFGKGVSSSAPTNYTINGTRGTGTDINGGSLVLAAGIPTGSGLGGDLVFQTANGGSTGAVANDLHERMRISQSGLTTINGNFQLIDGTQANGFVLSSDANGLASWKAVGSLVGAFTNNQGRTNAEAFGLNAVVNATDGTVFGNGAKTNQFGGVGGTAIGRGAGANNNYATSIGYNANAVTHRSTAIGSSTYSYQDSVAIGYGSNSGANSIAIGRSATVQSQSNTFVAGSSNTPITKIYFGDGIDDATPSDITFFGTSGEGTDIAGADLSITAGRGTGTTNGGDLIFYTANGSTTSSTTINTAKERMRITQAGLITVNGNFAIRDGTEQAGYVLTSDANGLASWQAAAGGSSPLTLTANNAAEIPLTLKGAAAQTANLQEWKNSANSVLASVSASGGFTAGSFTTTAATYSKSTLTSTGVYVGPDAGYFFGNSTWPTTGVTAGFVFDSAHFASPGSVALRSGTNAQSYRIYNTYTSSTNYERAVIDWQGTSNTLSIGTENGSTGGILRNINFIGGNIGINKASPSSKLDINGSIAIRDGTEQAGFILTSDANGLASWQAASGGGSSSGVAGAVQFSDGSSGLDSNAAGLFWEGVNGYLGIATNSPLYTLDVDGTAEVDKIKFSGIGYGHGIFSDSSNHHKWQSGYGITFEPGHSNTAAHPHTFDFDYYADRGIYTSGESSMMRLTYRLNSNNPDGYGLLINEEYGYAHGNGNLIGARFNNNMIFKVNTKGLVGINTDNAVANLDINGAIAIRDGTEQAGYVLTSDTNGLASWQAASGGAGDITSVGDCLTGACDDFTLTAATTGTSPLTIVATAGQTANLTEWQNGGGTVFAHINEDAQFSNTGGQTSSEIFGNGATTSSVENVVFGRNASSSYRRNVVIGYNASSVGTSSENVVIGRSASANTTGGSKTLLGYFSSGTGTGATAIGHSASSSQYSVAIGSSANATNNNSIALGRSATTTTTNQLVIGSNSSAIYNGYFGNGVTSTSPSDFNFHASGGSGTDINGASLVLAGGIPTGAGVGGDLVFQTANGGLTGAVANDLHERMRISESGLVTINGDLTVNKTIVFDGLFSNTSGTTINIDWNEGNKQTITLAHNVTTVNFTDPAGIASFVLVINQDGTGSRTITGWPASVKWPGGTAPTLSTAAGSVDTISCLFDGTNYLCQTGLDFQ